MTKASDNPYPSILLAEQGSDPTTPDSGYWRAYAKSDGLYVIDDAGATTGPFGTGGGGGISSGSSFPGGPSTNDLFFHTTYQLLFFYDGTNWLSANQYQSTLSIQGAVLPLSSTDSFFSPLLAASLDCWIDKIYADSAVLTTNDGSKYWTVNFQPGPGYGSSWSFTTASDTHDVHTAHVLTVGEATGTNKYLQATMTKTSTPGNLYLFATALYRIIGT